VGGGLEQTISLAELTGVCSQITGNTISISQTAENRPGDIPIYVTDNTKITELSGWRPEITIPTLLTEIHDWFIQDQTMLKTILA
jgi:CDP-paratose 2-epimerase